MATLIKLIFSKREDEKTQRMISFDTVSKFRNQLMGIAMLYVMVFHMTITRADFGDGILYFLVKMGNSGVDIFVFLSGIGMTYSLDLINRYMSANENVNKVLLVGSENFTPQVSSENEELYGVLSRYATAADCFENVAFVNYSLELWSAHLGNTEGFLWVYYSCEAIDYDGNVVCGSWNVPALWKVEKDDTGAWAVVQIREHP